MAQIQGIMLQISEMLVKEAENVIADPNFDGILPVCLSSDMNVWLAYSEDEDVVGIPFKEKYKIGFKSNQFPAA